MNLSGTIKKMAAVIGAASLVIIAAGALFYRSAEAFPFALGVILTAGLNVAKLIMLERAVQRAVTVEDEKTGGNYIRGQYLLRFLLTGAVLVLAALTPFINLWGAAFGLFTLQISVYIVKGIMKYDEELYPTEPEPKPEPERKPDSES